MHAPVHRLALMLAAGLSSLSPIRPAVAVSEQGIPGTAGQAGQAEGSRISVKLDTVTMLSGEKGDIEVLQLLRVVNSGDVPYLGHPPKPSGEQETEMARAVFRVPVPEGAFDIAPSDMRNPHGMRESPAGIVTTAPLPPGETLISFIYRIRPSRTGWAMRRQIDYPTRSINLLIGPGLELQSAPGFELTERKRLGDIEYRRFRAGPFSPGSVLTADVGFGGGSPDKLWLRFGSAAAVVAAIALGSAAVLRRRRATAPGPETAGGLPPATSYRENLILQIALLDEEFDSGSIPEETYQTRRRALKKELETLGETVAR